MGYAVNSMDARFRGHDRMVDGVGAGKFLEGPFRGHDEMGAVSV
jgi:hypothetical protein